MKMEKVISSYLARNASCQIYEVDAVSVSRTDNIDILSCPSVNNKQTREPLYSEVSLPPQANGSRELAISKPNQHVQPIPATKTDDS